ncbi:MAG: signal peptidase I [Acidobacteriota bacterium]
MAKTEYPPLQRSTVREYVEALLIAAIFLGFSNTFLVKTFYIPSGSMESTLLIGDHLFVNRYLYGHTNDPVSRLLSPNRDVERGDIVVFRSPEDPRTDLVKRCLGLPGDTIRIVDKVLYVNDQPVVDDSYTQHVDPRIFPNRPYLSAQVRLRDNFGPFTVPEGEYFFLGDNRDRSNDSRFWGTVPRSLIKGRALMIYWSFGGETPDGVWRGWGHKLVQLGRTVGGFFSESRWSRSFQLIR